MLRFTSQEEFVRSALVRPCFLHREEGDLGLDEAQKLPLKGEGSSSGMQRAMAQVQCGWPCTIAT